MNTIDERQTEGAERKPVRDTRIRDLYSGRCGARAGGRERAADTAVHEPQMNSPKAAGRAETESPHARRRRKNLTDVTPPPELGDNLNA